MAKTEIRIGGLGGQGVILSGTIVGKAAALYGGKHSTMIQAFGPEARGSACSAQVTLSDDPIGYPYVKSPDVLVVMSRDAYAQFAGSLKPGGMLLYEEELVEPQQLAEGVRTFGIPATRFAEELGRRLVMSIVMVGFFAGVTGLMPASAYEKAVLDSVPRGTENLNLGAFRKGYEFGRGLAEKSAG
jgi:2-oxoglutarate ferredoxin oxidoreductase subunit gamma